MIHTNPTISAIMIVRDEETNLARCLSSIRDQVDEIIIVDTGSTDATMDIAKKYGAKIFEHPWENDFSKHRNQSVGYANSDWLFQIDADEELILGDGSTLRETVKACDDVDAILITLESRWENGLQSIHNTIRIFRNLPHIRYKGRVHNEVVGVRTGKYVPLRLFHYGYDVDEATFERKFHRTVNILLQDVKDDPKNPRAHHYLGISYLSKNMYDEAIQSAETAISLCRDQGNLSDLYSGSYYVASVAHMRQGNRDKAEYWAKEALQSYPIHLDSLFVLSEVYYQKRDLPLFYQYTNQYLDLLKELEESGERFGTYIFQTTGFRWLAYLYRACIQMDQGILERAAQELENALNLAPDKSHFHHLLAGYYLQNHQIEKSALEFEKALEESPDNIEVLWDFSQLRKKRDEYGSAKELFERILTIQPLHKQALFEMGNEHLKSLQLESAIEYYQRVLEIDNQHISTKMNMALALRKMGQFDASIRYSLDVIKEKPSSLEALSNLAYAYYGQGNDKMAATYFMKISKFHPDQPDPHVYLALIFLSNNDLESCVSSCDHLLSLLGLERNLVLDSFSDLGDRFFSIAQKLSGLNQSHLSSICLQIGQILADADSPAHI
ncbi:MAG: glycosyltransferase [Deltaproteobacteria bacterium]|nr:glycosyltransferase [Deltaproteobacteria bacterium]